MLRLILVTLFVSIARSSYIKIDPSDGSFEIPIVCSAGAYYDLDSSANGACRVCDKNTFQTSYGAESLDVSVEYRHGQCCSNAHHHVCAVLLEEWQNRCGANLCPRQVNGTDSI